MFDDLASIGNAFKAIAGMKLKQEEPGCSLAFRPGRHGTDAIVDCGRCPGGSSLSDPGCRLRLVKSLAGK